MICYVLIRATLIDTTYSVCISIFLYSVFYLTFTDECVGGTEAMDKVVLVTRSEWGARRPKQEDHMDTPVQIVIIHHATMGEADTLRQCCHEARTIQNIHMNERGNLTLDLLIL